MKVALFDADVAARHLLRNMHDPTALRANPLVEHYFALRNDLGVEINAEDALSAIRNAVVTTVHRIFDDAAVGRAHVHLRRQREIVMRCDIGGEPDKVVQDGLGLERRQFYREKKRARTRLANALEALRPAAIRRDHTVSTDAGELYIAHYRALHDAGDRVSAAALAASLLRSTDDAQRRVELAALLVACHAENGSWAEASEILVFAYGLGCDDARSHARLAWAESLLMTYQGLVTVSEDRARAAIRYALELGEQRTDVDDELLTLAYLQVAFCRHTVGAYEGTLEALQMAREVVALRPSLPPRVKVNLLFHLGGALTTMPGGAQAAERHLQEAFAISTRHGLARDAAGVALNLACLYRITGDIERALEIGRAGLAISERVRGAAGHGWYMLSFALVELAAGNTARALEHAQLVGSAGSPELPLVAYARVVEADALLQTGKAREAQHSAESAIEPLRSRGQRRLLAHGLRVFSDAAHRLGEATHARRSIIESVDLNERFGNPHSLATALRSQGKIMGEVRYERDAGELFASLRLR